ncbi:hypothetical protein NLI96_g9509 [Meripilus lineatus]|uniref:non-specific serine/threonine protein kinase n=1 Tax=Meripilus lineatus TaxID=2056292 RepID=A0AAD5YF54_9APHY|nr:hypothetical protein NLI96_g9509 [Physisporinus lineatus]
MPFLVKVKTIFKKKEKTKGRKRGSAGIIAFPKLKRASLVSVLSTTSRPGARLVISGLLHGTPHETSVVCAGAPLGHGALAELLHFLLKMRRKPVKVKVPLGVDCHLQKNPQLIKNVQHCKAEQPPVAGEIVDICASKPTRGDFSLIKRLGSGAYGTVYLAQHNPSGVRVALKAISKVPRGKDGRSCELSEEALEKRVHGIRGKASLDLLDCTLDEFFALLRLRGEKTMLQIHAAFHDLRYWYIATTYHAGGDLESLLQLHGPLPESTAHTRLTSGATGMTLYELLTGKLPWDSFEWKKLSDLGELIVCEPIGFTETDRVRLKIGTRCEQFILSALDKEQETRPTPAQLRTHAFFNNFDWERHSHREAPSSWRLNINDEASPEAKNPRINSTRIFKPEEDPLPHFSFLSTSLSILSPPRLQKESSQDSATNSTHVSKSLSTLLSPTSLAVPIVSSVAASHTASSPSIGPSVTFSFVSPTPSIYSASSRLNGFSKLKRWAGTIWRGFK